MDTTWLKCGDVEVVQPMTLNLYNPPNIFTLTQVLIHNFTSYVELVLTQTQQSKAIQVLEFSSTNGVVEMTVLLKL